MFARSIGSAVGVAVFGAIANAIIDAIGRADHPQAVIDADGGLPGRSAAAVLTIVVSLLMPKIRADDAEAGQPEVTTDRPRRPAGRGRPGARWRGSPANPR